MKPSEHAACKGKRHSIVSHIDAALIYAPDDLVKSLGEFALAREELALLEEQVYAAHNPTSVRS